MPNAATAVNEVRQTDLDDKAYILDLSNWGLGTPATPTLVAVLQLSNNTDVKDTTTTGAASFSGTNLTTPRINNLTLGEQYLVRLTFVDSGNTWEANFIIDCRRD